MRLVSLSRSLRLVVRLSAGLVLPAVVDTVEDVPEPASSVSPPPPPAGDDPLAIAPPLLPSDVATEGDETDPATGESWMTSVESSWDVEMVGVTGLEKSGGIVVVADVVVGEDIDDPAPPAPTVPVEEWPGRDEMEPPGVLRLGAYGKGWSVVSGDESGPPPRGCDVEGVSAPA